MTFRQDASVIYADVEKDGGGDLTIQIDGTSRNLDCTTLGKATVALVPGSATILQENWVYVDLVSNVATLKSSATKPSGDMCMIGKTNLLDLARFTADGNSPITKQQFNNASSINGQGIITRTADRVRKDGAKYISGIDQSLSITSEPLVVDVVDLSTTAGVVYQFNEASFDELLSPNKYIVINHPT